MPHPKSQILNDQRSLLAFGDTRSTCSDFTTFYDRRSAEEEREEISTGL